MKPAPYSTNQTREPGLTNFGIGCERYVVRGGALTVIPISSGDEIEIVDPHGLQCAHLLAFDSEGNDCVAQISPTTTVPGAELVKMLHTNTLVAANIKSKIKQSNSNLADLKAALLLNGETEANSRVSFTFDSDCTIVVGAPCGAMRVDQHCPPTDLIVWITRASPNENFLIEPPDPLANPIQDFTIKAATATSYEVKAGQFIQIIDIQGRQCSDFQCFDVKALDRGIERCLDATATRSLMGAIYPTPGLHSKFYDVDLEPLIEVIQDTCGRHDSFGLACTSKYYDELGYPGHSNCSDNFNYALEQYPITARKGWMAMNLFFNTFIGDNHQLYLDEPWSRPGDYVLFQAMRDLVCVSSSCPDDIDAANGWNPTDMQVRVYDKNHFFKRAVAVRKTADAEPTMTQETGFHPETSKLTRDFIEYAGFWIPNTFTNLGAISEYWACREKAAMIDLSPLRKYEVTGPDAQTLLQTCVTRDIKKLAVGQVTYTAMCNASGGMIDDGTVFRLSQTNFRWVGGSDDSGLWLQQQARKLDLKAWVKDSTDQLANVQVQGPNSRQILSKVVWTRPDQASVEELGWFRFSIARMLDSNGIPIVISRTGYTGELGYEIFCHPRDAAEVWRILIDQEGENKITPMGLEALDLLRIEAGLVFAGVEFCDQTDPFEAGIPFAVPLKSKTDDFIGRSALESRYSSPQRQLVGLEMKGREEVAGGDGVFDGRQKVGEITSACLSPILDKSIALCRMNIEYVDIGTKVEVGKLDQHQKRIPAEVVPFPHFDPNKSRVRGNYAN